MSLDYALRADPQPDRIARFPQPCPRHPVGDEARLDYRADGWPGARCLGKHRGRCVCVWRVSFLCDLLFTEHYCEKSLPDDLRRLG